MALLNVVVTDRLQHPGREQGMIITEGYDTYARITANRTCVFCTTSTGLALTHKQGDEYDATCNT